MASQVILHIGPHKTGTTALQNWLFANGTFLRTHGFHVPDLRKPTVEGLPNAKHHSVLASAIAALAGEPISDLSPRLPSVDQAKDIIGELENAFASEAGCIIISSEMFWLMGPLSIQKTSEIIMRNCPSVIVVAYIRNLGTWLGAWVTQRICNPSAPFPHSLDPLEIVPRTGDGRDVLDWDAVLSRWEDDFENVVVRPYGGIEHFDIVEDFLFVLGVADREPSATRAVFNPSIGSRETKYIYEMRARGVKIEGLKNIFAVKNRETPARICFGTEYMGHLAARYKDSILNVSRRLGTGSDHDLTPNAPSNPCQRGTWPPSLTADEIVEFTARIVSKGPQ